VPLITQAAAEAAVRPHFDDLVHVVQAAWKDWREASIASQMQHKRVRANYVWNQLIAHAKRRFDGHAVVRVETISRWDGLLVGDAIFIRMKKANRDLLSRNYPTQSALAFLDQTQDLFGGVARLELVYLLDDSETSIERIVLMQRHRNSVAWMIDLFGEAPMLQNVIPLSEPPAPTGSVAQRIMKPKREQNDGNKDVSTGG
jgi:hypothetical protein